MKFNKGDIVDVRGWVVYEQDEDGEVGVALCHSDDAAVFVKPEALTPAPRTLPPPGTVVCVNGCKLFITEEGVVDQYGRVADHADLYRNWNYEVLYTPL